jgi:hypothetical protein
LFDNAANVAADDVGRGSERHVDGKESCAWVAGPPSPEKPDAPVPATVVIQGRAKITGLISK